MINVTKTYLPNKEKYQSYVDEIYANGWVTNNGPLVQRPEGGNKGGLIIAEGSPEKLASQFKETGSYTGEYLAKELS